MDDMNANDILVKAAQGERLTPDEGLILYRDGDPDATMAVAHQLRLARTTPG